MSKFDDFIENSPHKVTRGTLARFLETLGECIKAAGDMVHPEKK
jgi:hypothetical protein